MIKELKTADIWKRKCSSPEPVLHTFVFNPNPLLHGSIYQQHATELISDRLGSSAAEDLTSFV